MIDEKKLIEDLKEYAHISSGDSVDTIKLAIKIAEEQQTVGDWIPCSERMPDMHREDMESAGEYYMISDPVIVTDGQHIYIAEYEEDINYSIGWHSVEGSDYKDIIAWKPLPGPYNTERSGK